MAEIGMMLAMGKKAKKEMKKAKLPPPPTPESPTVAAARRSVIARERRAMGRSGTILTGPQGLTGDPLIGRKTLLGQ